MPAPSPRRTTAVRCPPSGSAARAVSHAACVCHTRRVGLPSSAHRAPCGALTFLLLRSSHLLLCSLAPALPSPLPPPRHRLAAPPLPGRRPSLSPRPCRVLLIQLDRLPQLSPSVRLPFAAADLPVDGFTTFVPLPRLRSAPRVASPPGGAFSRPPALGGMGFVPSGASTVFPCLFLITSGEFATLVETRRSRRRVISTSRAWGASTSASPGLPPACASALYLPPLALIVPVSGVRFFLRIYIYAI